MSSRMPRAGLRQSSEVLGRREPLRLEAPHLTRRRRAALRRFAADNPAHRRIVAQALGVVHILPRIRQGDQIPTAGTTRRMGADHSCHCVRRPEHHPPSRSNRVRRRVRDNSNPASEVTREPRNWSIKWRRKPAEQHPIPIHPLGAPWPPRSIQGKMLIAISESRRPRRNSVRYPVNAGCNVPTISPESFTGGERG